MKEFVFCRIDGWIIVYEAVHLFLFRREFVEVFPRLTHKEVGEILSRQNCMLGMVDVSAEILESCFELVDVHFRMPLCSVDWKIVC